MSNLHIAFAACSLEQVRHATAMTTQGIRCTLVYEPGNDKAPLYKRYFTDSIEAKDMPVTLVELNPNFATLTLPTYPLDLVTNIVIQCLVNNIQVCPFLFEPPHIHNEHVPRKLAKLLVGLCNNGYTTSAFHLQRLDRQIRWIPFGIQLKPQIVNAKIENSIVYPGSLHGGWGEQRMINLLNNLNNKYPTFVYQRKDRPDNVEDTSNLKSSIVPTVIDIQLIDELTKYEYGICAPAPEKGVVPIFDDWIIRSCYSSKLSLYLEAGVVPIIHKNSEAQASVIKSNGLGIIYNTEDGSDISFDKTLLPVYQENIRKFYDKFSYNNVNWETVFQL
jgi:hypothetical protein